MPLLLLTKQHHLLTRDAETGQGLVEYALVIFVVGLAVLAGLGLVGTNLNSIFSGLAGWIGTTFVIP